MIKLILHYKFFLIGSFIYILKKYISKAKI